MTQQRRCLAPDEIDITVEGDVGISSVALFVHGKIVEHVFGAKAVDNATLIVEKGAKEVKLKLKLTTSTNNGRWLAHLSAGNRTDRAHPLAITRESQLDEEIYLQCARFPHQRLGSLAKVDDKPH